MSVGDFTDSVNGTWISWGVHNFVRRPLTWAVSTVFKTNEQILKGSYIVIDVLKVIMQN